MKRSAIFLKTLLSYSHTDILKVIIKTKLYPQVPNIRTGIKDLSISLFIDFANFTTY